MISRSQTPTNETPQPEIETTHRVSAPAPEIGNAPAGPSRKSRRAATARQPNRLFLQILKRLMNGDNEKLVADELNVTRQYVTQVRQTGEELEFLPKRGLMSLEQKQQRRRKIVEDARRGMRPGAIARRHGLSRGFVRLVCREHGVDFEAIAAQDLHSARFETRLAIKCVAELLLGVPPKLIRDRHGASEHYLTQVKELAVRMGLQLQSPGRKLSGEAVRYIAMSLRYLTIQQASIAFGITKRTAARIVEKQLCFEQPIIPEIGLDLTRSLANEAV